MNSFDQQNVAPAKVPLKVNPAARQKNNWLQPLFRRKDDLRKKKRPPNFLHRLRELMVTLEIAACILLMSVIFLLSLLRFCDSEIIPVWYDIVTQVHQLTAPPPNSTDSRKLKPDDEREKSRMHSPSKPAKKLSDDLIMCKLIESERARVIYQL
jgi:hypothetical protein